MEAIARPEYRSRKPEITLWSLLAILVVLLVVIFTFDAPLGVQVVGAAVTALGLAVSGVWTLGNSMTLDGSSFRIRNRGRMSVIPLAAVASASRLDARMTSYTGVVLGLTLADGSQVPVRAMTGSATRGNVLVDEWVAWINDHCGASAPESGATYTAVRSQAPAPGNLWRLSGAVAVAGVGAFALYEGAGLGGWVFPAVGFAARLWYVRDMERRTAGRTEPEQ